MNFLPLFPLRSRFCVVAARDAKEEGAENTAEVDQVIPLVPESVLVAYVRSWGVLAAVIVLLRAFFGAERGGMEAEVSLFVLLAIVLVLAWSWFLVGKPTAEEEAQWRVYGSFASHPVDVALLGDQVAAVLRARLVDAVREHVPALMSGTYRSAPDPARDWQAMAVDPNVHEPEFLRAAMTLARVEWKRAPKRGDARDAWARTHDAIWTKLKAIEAKSKERAPSLP